MNPHRLGRLAKGLIQTAVASVWRIYVMLRFRAVRKRPLTPRNMMIITWAFPPMATVGVHVVSSFAGEASRAGWKVTVVCGPIPKRPSSAGFELLASIPAAVKICRVSSLLMNEYGSRLYPLAGTVPQIDGGYLTALALLDRAMSCIGDEAPSVVIATGPRFSNFLAAHWIADKFKSTLAIHYRDEWTVRTPDFVKAGKQDCLYEIACLERADLVFFSSDSKLASYRQAYPKLNPEKLAVMMNGWDPYFHRRPLTATGDEATGHRRFTLVYLGRWHRPLSTFLRTFDKLLSNRPEWTNLLQLVFVGEQNMENVQALNKLQDTHPGSVNVLPHVGLAQAIAMMRVSSVLLLINEHDYDGVIPQKTYDYLATDRPILVYGETGGAARIVREADAGIVVKAGDALALLAAVEKLMVAPPASWLTESRSAWVQRTNRTTLLREAFSRIEHAVEIRSH